MSDLEQVRAPQLFDVSQTLRVLIILVAFMAHGGYLCVREPAGELTSGHARGPETEMFSDPLVTDSPFFLQGVSGHTQALWKPLTKKATVPYSLPWSEHMAIADRVTNDFQKN